MNEFEKMFDGDTSDIVSDIMDIKESARINTIIAKLVLYTNNPKELTDIYTEILEDDNVSYMIVKISQNKIFAQHFPEFYEKNMYGENLINCQQNSSYHKYSAFRHILATVESVGNPQIPIGDDEKKILKWTMLLHDIGKPFVKVIKEDGTESFAGHDEKSLELAKQILDRFYFTQEEKKIILALIKYHDKYLNEGEITYDNMKFLASELNNNKELFYMLIDVKDADAKSKNVDVYNKYKLVKNKYLEFINTFFSYNTNNSENDITVEGENSNEEVLEPIVKENTPITLSELDTLIEQVMDRKKITALYQPVIDLKQKSIYGYETFTKIENDKKIDVIEFLNRAKDSGKYDKLQQSMLINGIENFENIAEKEAKLLFVNSDIASYEKYVNKPRLYDMMSKNKIVIEFHNYEKRDFTEMQKTIDIIHKNKGYVALDNFGVGELTTDDISLLNIDYIVPDMSLINNILEDVEKQKYMIDLITYSISKEINVIIVGVENKEILQLVKSMGVRYVQGYYFEKPSAKITSIYSKVQSLLNSTENDTIS